MLLKQPNTTWTMTLLNNAPLPTGKSGKLTRDPIASENPQKHPGWLC